MNINQQHQSCNVLPAHFSWCLMSRCKRTESLSARLIYQRRWDGLVYLLHKVPEPPTPLFSWLILSLCVCEKSHLILLLLVAASDLIHYIFPLELWSPEGIAEKLLDNYDLLTVVWLYSTTIAAAVRRGDSCSQAHFN